MIKIFGLIACLSAFASCATDDSPDTSDVNGTWEFTYGVYGECPGQQRERVQVMADADPLFEQHDPSWEVETSLDSGGGVFILRVVDGRETALIRVLAIELNVGDDPTAMVDAWGGPSNNGCAFHGSAVVEKLSDDPTL